MEEPDVETLSRHYDIVGKAFASGRVVPFLGAGVNLCGRPKGVDWTFETREYLPSGWELANHLATECSFPESEVKDLTRVSQFVSLVVGEEALYEDLHAVFNADYPPTALHRFLAELPRQLAVRGYPKTEEQRYRRLLIVTTNYDDLMERAFEHANQEYHLLSYEAVDRDYVGKFWHTAPDESRCMILDPTNYKGIRDDLPVVLKIHGAVDRTDCEKDSYVITEDHYIDFLANTDAASLIPASLLNKMKKSHLLFLGYRLRDWNLRVILHRIWRDKKLDRKSWSIQLEADEIDREFWKRHNVEILEKDLVDYVAGFSTWLDELDQVSERD